MKSKLFIFFLILALGAGAWFSYKKASRKSTLEKLDLNFSVTDTASVDKIVIEPVNGKESVLIRNRESGGWTLNEKFKVSPVLMDVLLTTIRNVEMLRPVSRNESATAIESMERRGKKVSVYVNGELYKSYRLGDDAPGYKGTYLQLEGGNPYVAYLRGFSGFLSPRYNVREKDWRDRLLISCPPEQIKSLSLSYRKMPSENVNIQLSASKIQLLNAGRFDTAAVAAMLSSFRKIYVEQYLEYFPEKTKDSLLLVGSEWSMDLQSHKPELSRKIEFFTTSDPDRWLAYLPESSEWITIQQWNFEPILKRKTSLLL